MKHGFGQPCRQHVHNIYPNFDTFSLFHFHKFGGDAFSEQLQSNDHFVFQCNDHAHNILTSFVDERVLLLLPMTPTR